MQACFHVSRSYPQQRGAVLFICLIILLVITILGITASQTTILEEKMAGNLNAYNMAFEGTEADLRACESRLRTTLKPSVDPYVWVLNKLNPNYGSTGFDPDNPPWWVLRGVAWWQNNGGGQGGGGTSHSYNLPNNLNGLQQSSCVIEYLGWERQPLNVGRGYMYPPQKMDYYRVTASSSTGNNNNTIAILQSVFEWQYKPN
jgi:type IV pilus assembly protein PilX